MSTITVSNVSTYRSLARPDVLRVAFTVSVDGLGSKDHDRTVESLRQTAADTDNGWSYLIARAALDDLTAADWRFIAEKQS